MNTKTDIIIQVFYPLRDGRIVLRTELDWEGDVAARSVSADGGCYEFTVVTDRPFLYYKPVLLRHDETVWSLGKNYLALNGATGPQAIYPHFFDTGGCSACELHMQTLLDGRRYAWRAFYPPGYHENTLKRYPVLYMQDGQNLFFHDEAFLGRHWRVGETLTALDAMNAIDEVIVVGVYPHERERDYTNPGYEDYGRFLIDTLKPRVDAEYRTLTGPEHTAVKGSSLGGVVSFYLAWQRPDVFGMAACLSSTFGWRDDLRARVVSEPKRAIRLYLDSGWPRDNYEVTRDMRALLANRGYREGSDLLYFAFPEALHDEHHWAMRSHIPFQFFFGKRPAPVKEVDRV